MDVPHKTVAKAAETNVSAGPVFNPANQQVGQQFNPAGPTTIHLNPPPSVRLPITRAEIIQAVEREFGQDLRLLERCYVTPDLQDFNPPDEMNSPSLIVSRQPAFQLIDSFIDRPNLTESGQRCLFVLTVDSPLPMPIVESGAGVGLPRDSLARVPWSASAIWRAKLEFLLTEEAKAFDPAQKFKLQHDIAEARAKVRELGGRP